MLVNVLISGLVAFGFYSPLTSWLDGQLGGQWTYVLDYVIVWGLFVATMVICRTLTRRGSATRMRFRNPIDSVAGPILGLLAAWVLASFVMATLHMVPMKKDSFGGMLLHSTSDVESKSSLTAPDLGWLRFVERMSQETSFGSSSTNRFSAIGFIAAYQNHRANLEKATTKSLRVNRG